jgi:hypothetical protein
MQILLLLADYPHVTPTIPDHYNEYLLIYLLVCMVACSFCVVTRAFELSCNTLSTLGQAVLTPGSSLGLYIVPTDQQESFVRTLSSLMCTR